MPSIVGRRRLLLMGGLCLFLILGLAGGVFYARPHSQNPSGQQQEFPEFPTLALLPDGQIHWLRGSGKFEDVPLGTSVEKEIVLVSQCSQPLRELLILPSCACTRPHLEKDVLRPGESTKVTFVYNSHNRAGDVRAYFVVQSKEAPPYRVDLIFSHAQRFDVGDVTLQREQNRNFVQTSSGFWIPLSNRVESYTLTRDGSSKLLSITESLAIHEPETNGPTQPDDFVLKPGANTLILPKENKGDSPDGSAASQDGSRPLSWRFRNAIIVLTILVVGLGVGALYLRNKGFHMRRHAKPRYG